MCIRRVTCVQFIVILFIAPFNYGTYEKKRVVRIYRKPVGLKAMPFSHSGKRFK